MPICTTRLSFPLFCRLLFIIMTARLLNGFKISDINQLILALKFRFGVIWSKKLDVKFSHVFIRHKDTQ